MTDVLIIIQARMGSTRLPGKVLLPFRGKTVIENVYDTCNTVAKTVVAVPENTPKDQELISFLKERSIAVFHTPGNENDVLTRYYRCAQWNGSPQTIVRITADCPLVPLELIQLAIKAHKISGKGYTSFVRMVSGFDVEVFSFEMLKQAWISAIREDDREHVTPWMHGQGSHLIRKLSLDTPEDYEYLKMLVED